MPRETESRHGESPLLRVAGWQNLSAKCRYIFKRLSYFALLLSFPPSPPPAAQQCVCFKEGKKRKEKTHPPTTIIALPDFRRLCERQNHNKEMWLQKHPGLFPIQPFKYNSIREADRLRCWVITAPAVSPFSSTVKCTFLSPPPPACLIFSLDGSKKEKRAKTCRCVSNMLFMQKAVSSGTEEHFPACPWFFFFVNTISLWRLCWVAPSFQEHLQGDRRWIIDFSLIFCVSKVQGKAQIGFSKLQSDMKTSLSIFHSFCFFIHPILLNLSTSQPR